MVRIAILLSLLAGCTTEVSDAYTVNRRIWHIEFDTMTIYGELAPREQTMVLGYQPTCDAGCTCEFGPANDQWDDDKHWSYAGTDYREVCADTNLETNCTIYFTSDNEGDGDCQLNSITQPGWAGWESMHLRTL
jgi:hypothetical protein